MKILWTALLLLSMCCTAWADQQTTVLTENATYGKVVAQVPFIDGSNNVNMEKSVNSLIKERAERLAKKLNKEGQISYQVVLNRPSLVSIILEGKDAKDTYYTGLNLDLTTGAEFVLADFFVATEELEKLADSRPLFTEEGLLVQEKQGPYGNLLPYSKLLPYLRIGEAGRILQLAKLTPSCSGKELKVQAGSLLAFKMDTNPSTGYRWEPLLPTGVVKVGSSFTMPMTDQPRMGAGGVEILVLAVMEPGSYDLQLDYKRPWERSYINRLTLKVLAQ